MKYLSLILFFSLIGCGALKNENISKIEWDEKGHNPFSEITSGIPVYNKTEVIYKQNGKSILKIEFGEPIVVGIAEKPEKWGFFQFPNIHFDVDNNIVASWSMSADDISSYGKGGSSYSISKDGGKTWTMLTEPPRIKNGLLLPNGDKIKIHTPQALKVDALQLPKPVGESYEIHPEKGHYTYLYKVTELPKQLQGIYLSRLKKGEKKWKVEQAVMNDPLAVRYSRQGMFPVVWWGDMRVATDNFIYAGIYPGFSLEKEGKVRASGVFFYRSKDSGYNWEIISRIPYNPDTIADPHGKNRLIRGYHEPAFEILPDGSFLCIMRTTDGWISPMYYTRSTDMGLTWTKPIPFTRNGVKPRTIQLNNGTIVLASGRPGMQVRFCIDKKGEKWTDPFEMLPFESEKETVSCGYPSLLSTGNNEFLIIYSDFKFNNEIGEIRKAIKVRNIKVEKIN